MTHKELTAELAQRLNWTQTKVSDTLEKLVSIANEKLADGEQIAIQNFGIFETRRKTERISVNPQNGERYLIPPSIVATFKPASALKEQYKNSGNDGK